jgi:hypothetical protein
MYGYIELCLFMWEMVPVFYWIVVKLTIRRVYSDAVENWISVKW